MRNVWLMLVICGLQLIAAEKNRDWKSGQIVESDQSSDSLHTIASTDRNYLVRGTIGNPDQELGIGATVRFAVEGKSMYISLAGREYRLYVLGERVAAPKDPAVAAVKAPAPATPAAQAPAPVVAKVKSAPEAPKPAPAAPKAPAVAAATGDILDNDAVVKMIVAGLKEDTIVRVIETRPGKYILTKDALGGLKAAGVPPSVIAAMSAKMTARH